jgi:hypothetical protein
LTGGYAPPRSHLEIAYLPNKNPLRFGITLTSGSDREVTGPTQRNPAFAATPRVHRERHFLIRGRGRALQSGAPAVVLHGKPVVNSKRLPGPSCGPPGVDIVRRAPFRSLTTAFVVVLGGARGWYRRRVAVCRSLWAPSPMRRMPAFHGCDGPSSQRHVRMPFSTRTPSCTRRYVGCNRAGSATPMAGIVRAQTRRGPL